jgi:O-antigen/teichoic acid export membrane protein
MNFSQAIVPPLTMTLSRRETEQAWDTVRRTTRVVSFILAPLVVFSSVFAGDLVILLFSGAFSQAGLFLRILAFIALLNFLCKLSWSIIVSDANPGARSLVYILAAVINVALNDVLIPRYGGSGAAWASMISFFVLSVALQILLAKKVGRMLPLGQILFFFVMAGISVPVYMLLGPLGHVARLIAGCSASFALYIIITALTGFIRKNDIEQAVAFSSSLPRPLHLLVSLIGKVVAKAARN